MGAAVHAGTGAGRSNRGRAAGGIAELGSAGVVCRQAWPAGDVGIAGLGSGASGPAAGSATGVGSGHAGRRACSAGWSTTRADVGFCPARASTSGPSRATAPGARAGVEPAGSSRSASAAPAATSASTRGTAARRCAAGAVVGVG
jgi:hypothetical protein